MDKLAHKIANLFIVGFQGSQVSTSLENLLQRYPLGGVLLFDQDWKKLKENHPNPHRNIINPIQLRKLCHDLRKKAGKHNTLFVAVDYEGGHISRLSPSNGFAKTHTAVEVAELNQAERKRYFNRMAETLNDYGFNLNFAPVVDLALAKNMLTEKDRTFSDNPQLVTEIASEFIKVMQQHAVLSCLKHFPGHGSGKADSHFDFVDLTENWKQEELYPYQKLISKCEYDFIMTAHVIQKQLDPSGLPATLSKPIITDLLKNKMQFKGIVISDDLQMAAIEKQYAMEEALIKAMNAGCDMFICANQLGKTQSVPDLIHMVSDAVTKGHIAPERIEDAYNRVAKVKTKLAFKQYRRNFSNSDRLAPQ